MKHFQVLSVFIYVSKGGSSMNIDKSILQRCKRNDKNAFADLFKFYQNYLFKLCFSFVQNEQEALDMLQAICSGHTGSLAILHANSPQDVVYRLETMILTSGLNISLEAIHRQIVTAVNLIVQQEQLPDGSRKITHITQVHGLNNAQVVLEDLFTYELESFGADGMAQGKWKASGITPVFSGLFKKSGINLPTELFNKD